MTASNGFSAEKINKLSSNVEYSFCGNTIKMNETSN